MRKIVRAGLRLSADLFVLRLHMALHNQIICILYIVRRRSKIRAKKVIPPTFSKNLILSRKPTKISQKLTKSQKIALSSFKQFKKALSAPQSA
jgi:hypothetical protein